MTAMRRILLVVVLFGLLGFSAEAAPGPWEMPAAQLAEQVAGILGPGQARLTVRNASSIGNDEIPTIRRLLELDLKGHGVLASGEESANLIRVTLSESARELLWVAEVVQGSETRVAMTPVGTRAASAAPPREQIEIHREIYLSPVDLSLGQPVEADDPILAVLETDSRVFVLRAQEVMVFHVPRANGKTQEVSMSLNRPLPRDPRGTLIPASDGESFTAFAGGNRCNGAPVPPDEAGAFMQDSWMLHCGPSDDPWPIAIRGAAGSPTALKGFYNAARNYFTGLLTPSLNADLPPFYNAIPLSRPGFGVSLLIDGIDGKVQLLENGELKPVSGTRDWGSDFALLRSGCGGGAQVVVSGSGEAAEDSLRAYELPGLEAVPVSAALGMSGTVTALWTAPDGKSLLAVVRSAAGEYEVDRVTASCN